MELLKRACPAAAEYLNKHCEPNKTFLYRILEEGYTTHGHKTSNIVEIMNSVIGEARFRDPYYLNDFMLKWHGEKLAERQEIGKQLKAHNKLLTTYASSMLGKREAIARESPLEIKAQGNGIYLVTDENSEERHNVDLKNKTCTCYFLRTHRIPCEHVVRVLDDPSNNLRDSPDKWYAFRKEWIAPYFWSHNYIDGYENESVITPTWVQGDKIELRKGDRVVTKPYMAEKNQKRNTTKRKTKGEGGRRSRAKFDLAGFQKHKRQEAGRQTPCNPFVRISDRSVFDKKPCGRKPLSHRARSMGSKRARRMLYEATKERENGTRTPSNSSRDRKRSNPRTRSKTQSQRTTRSQSQSARPHTPSKPDISTPHTPTVGSLEIPQPCIPWITQPEGFPNFDLSAYLSSPLITPFPLMPSPFGTGYPLILPNR